MAELSQQFELPGLTTTQSVPIRQGNETIARAHHKKRDLNQLPMFMTARQIAKQYEPLYGDRETVGPEEHSHLENDRQVWRRKNQETLQEPQFRKLLERNDVAAPIPLTFEPGDNKPMLAGGHHRVAYNLQHHPNRYLPVVHHEDTHKAIWEEPEDFPYT